MATKLFQPERAYGSLPWLQQQIERAASERFNHTVPVTPEIAAQLLLLNTNNRHIKIHALEQYRRAMRLGFWRGENGETIKIKKDGTLGDGQHRLRAIVDEGVTLTLVIAFGLDDADIATIDQGKARTAGDVDRLAGGEMSESAAACARKIISYEGAGYQSIGYTGRVSNAEVNDRLNRDGAIRSSVRWALANKCPGLPPSSIAFLHYVFSTIHQKMGEDYLIQVCKGINLSLNDPAATVRDYLIAVPGRHKKTHSQKIEATLRGWNAFREGRLFSKVVTNGAFPELV